MKPHVHINATHLLATIVVTIAVFGTLHLFAISQDTRFGRALQALNF